MGGGLSDGAGCDAAGGVDGATPPVVADVLPNENPPPAAAGVVEAAADVPLPNRAVVLFPQVTIVGVCWSRVFVERVVIAWVESESVCVV